MKKLASDLKDEFEIIGEICRLAAQQTIKRLSALIDARKPKEYSEMLENQCDIFLLTEAERVEFHVAKMLLPGRDQNAQAARARNLARRDLKKRAKLVK